MPPSTLGHMLQKALSLRRILDSPVYEARKSLLININVLVSALRSDMGASYAIVSQLPSERFRWR